MACAGELLILVALSRHVTAKKNAKAFVDPCKREPRFRYVSHRSDL